MYYVTVLDFESFICAVKCLMSVVCVLKQKLQWKFEVYRTFEMSHIAENYVIIGHIKFAQIKRQGIIALCQIP